jgi:hypothetical protein
VVIRLSAKHAATRLHPRASWRFLSSAEAHVRTAPFASIAGASDTYWTFSTLGRLRCP